MYFVMNLYSNFWRKMKMKKDYDEFYNPIFEILLKWNWYQNNSAVTAFWYLSNGIKFVKIDSFSEKIKKTMHNLTLVST